MKLTVVGLPLGNIKDISLRAIQTISQAPLVICEDTRRFHRLHQKLENLGHLDHPYQGEFAVLTDQKEARQTNQVIAKLQKHQSGILVSDAGLPTISDPGHKLINQLLELDAEINVIPGPTAAMSALAVSGLSADRVLFVGFLPKKTSKRKQIFNASRQLATQLPHTLIIYESPYRLESTLADLAEHFSSQTPLVVVRELTKQHQQIIRSTLSQIHDQLPDQVKGEVTLLVRAG